MSTTRPRIILKRGRANPLWRGHPWVYSGAVERIDGPEGSYEPGDLADVCDTEGRLIGRGFINPRSQIIVRLLTRREEPLSPEHIEDLGEQGMRQLIARRLLGAAALRQRLGLPSAHTTAYRLVNSEGDFLPGVVVDMYDRVAAVQFTALGMKRNEAAVYDGLLALPEPVRPQSVVEVAAGGFAQLEGFGSATRAVRGPLLEEAQGQGQGREAGLPIPCKEDGLLLEVDPLHGQKTGMFLDQRENRVQLAQYAQGARFLDVYCYSGGFALHALRHGAREATCVDSSARALQRAKAHAELNGLAGLETVEADAFRYLEGAVPRSFDIVVVDPPKFARAHKDLPSAMKGYQRLNALALGAVSAGGLLATCSCSQLVDSESFERMVAAAAHDAGRRVTVLESASQGPDHPVPPAFPEGRYLKFLLLGVS